MEEFTILIYDSNKQRAQRRATLLKNIGYTTIALNTISDISESPEQITITHPFAILTITHTDGIYLKKVADISQITGGSLIFLTPDEASFNYGKLTQIPNLGLISADISDHLFTATLESAIKALERRRGAESPSTKRFDAAADNSTDQLRFLESLDKVNLAIQEAGDLEMMLKDVLDRVLSIFDCDRANLVYPCNPESATFRVRIESTKPEYPGLGTLNRDFTVDEKAMADFAKIKSSQVPVILEPNTMSQHTLDQSIHGHKSVLALALRPKIGDLWSFSIHQCDRERIWTGSEKQLFLEISHRIEAGLNSLLLINEYRENELRLREVHRIAKIGWLSGRVGNDQIQLSPEFCKIHGFPYQKTISQGEWVRFWEKIIFPTDRERLDRLFNDAIANNSHYETTTKIKRLDGEVRDLYVYLKVSSDNIEKSQKLLGMVQDITHTVEAQLTLEHANSTLKTLTECNQVLIRSTEEQKLLHDICATVCKQTDYSMAWVGLVTNFEEKTIEPVAWAGFEDGFFKQPEVTQIEDKEKLGPVRGAVWQGEIARIPDIEYFPRIDSWRQEALKRGYRSNLIIPLLGENNKLLGILSIFSNKIGIFETGKTWLLEELANDLTYGILSLRARLERTQAQEKLEQSNKLLQAIIQSAPVAIVGMDLEGSVDMVWNPAAEMMFGWKKEEVMGKLLPTAPTESPENLKHFKRLTRSAAVLKGDIFHRQKRNGEYIDFEAYSSPMFGTDGNLHGSLSVFMDITEKSRYQAALLESEERYRSIYENSPLGIFRADIKGKMGEMNPAMIAMLGYQPEDMSDGIPVSVCERMFVSEEDRIEIFSAARLDEISIHQAQFRKKDDSEFLANIYLKRIRENKDKPLAFEGIVEDITERKQNEDLIIQTEKMISLGGLAAGIAHEINNPLGAILMGAFSVKKRLDPTNPKNKDIAEKYRIDLEKVQQYMVARDIPKNLESIMASGKRASEIIADMLQFSRKSESKKSYYQLDRLVEKTIDLAGKDYDLKKKFDFRKISIIREYDHEGANLSVFCIETEIEQVILNLLKNASQALGKAGTQRPRIVIRISRNKEMARVELEDNGPGIQESLKKRIFEPFFTTKPVGEGTGLGLSVSYAIIAKNHGGTMTVESELGKGTTIAIEIPIKPPETSAKASSS